MFTTPKTGAGTGGGAWFGLPMALAIMLLLSGCATTTAPTESTTNTLDKTVNVTLDASSSSSPGASGSGSAGVEAFTRANFASLKGEMAAGNGEHLAALGALLHIPDAERDTFYQLTRENYRELYPSPATTPEDMLLILNHTLVAASLVHP